jgi:hypothetical protein
MIRISAFVWILILGLLGVGLFQVKYNVQSKEAELRSINKQIDANHSAIHVLQAEWSYLNDPNRLADLTRRHTDLVPTQATQIKQFSDLPPRPATAQSDLPALSSAVPSSGAATGTMTAAAPALSTPTNAQPAAHVVQVSATPGSVPTAMPAVASTTAAAGTATTAAKVATVPTTKTVPASTAKNAQAAKPAATQASKPGADEVIDAILADMQRKQSTATTPPAGDQ